MSKNLMCSEHKTNSKKYRDEYDRIFNNHFDFHQLNANPECDDVKQCPFHGYYFNIAGKDVCPYCGY